MGESSESKALPKFYLFIYAYPSGSLLDMEELTAGERQYIGRFVLGVKSGDNINIWCNPWVPTDSFYA